MADGVAITAGSGTTILTDDTGAGGHAQVVKLAISADGDGTLLPADATNGIDVDVTRVKPDGTNTMPSMDAAARRGYVQVTDGTNTMPTLDAAARRGYVQLTDGSNTVSVVNSALQVTGGVAHDGVDAGNPNKIGARARTSNITAVASDDRTDLIADVQGRLVTSPYSIADATVTGTASATGTADTAVLSAAGAGVRNFVTSIVIYNDSTTNTFVNIKDGTTTRLVVAAPAKGGAVLNLTVPLRGTANTAVNFASGTGVTTMYVSMIGFTGA